MGVDPRELHIGDTVRYANDYIGTVLGINENGVLIKWFELSNQPFNYSGRYNFTHARVWGMTELLDKYDPSISPVVRKIRKMWDRSNYAKSLTTSAV